MHWRQSLDDVVQICGGNKRDLEVLLVKAKQWTMTHMESHLAKRKICAWFLPLV